jgi:hypothetical protein
MKRREIKAGPQSSSKREEIILEVANAMACIGKVWNIKI